MDLTSLKTKLEEAEFNQLQEYISTLMNQKEEARQESIAGRKSLKAEVEKLRGIKETLYTKLGIDGDDVDLDALEIPTKGKEVEAAKQFERKVKKLEQELLVEREANAKLDGKYKGTLTESALRKALAAHEFVDMDLVTDYVKQRTKFEDDQLVYVDGDSVLSVEEGVKLLATQKPHLLKAQGQGGSGFNPNTGKGKSKTYAEMTLTERSILYKENKQLHDQLKAA